MENAEVFQVHILAHDYGDTVAQELLARYEVKIRKFVLYIKLRYFCDIAAQGLKSGEFQGNTDFKFSA